MVFFYSLVSLARGQPIEKRGNDPALDRGRKEGWFVAGCFPAGQYSAGVGFEPRLALLVTTSLPFALSWNRALETEGILCGLACSLPQASQWLRVRPPVVAVIDLKAQNAIRLIDELIRTGVPVVAIATSPGDRVSALNRGCSWALPPDAHPDEMAHALRGTLKANPNLVIRDTLDLGPLLIDFGSRRLEWHGQQVALSRQLFELLGVLALHPGQPVAVDALITAICLKRFGTADDVYHAVNRLRKVLNDHGHIRNRRGFGYMFVQDEPEATELESAQKAPAAAHAS